MTAKIRDCQSIRESVVSFLAGNTLALDVGHACVITVPFLTVDGRWADVFIEDRLRNSLIVHDNGKASAEMFLQGVAITKRVRREFAILAKKYEVEYNQERERFEALCKAEDAQDSIMRIATCSTVASRNLLEVSSIAEQESAVTHVREFLTRWKRRHRKIKLSENVSFEGAAKQHSFDFVLKPPSDGPVAVAVLSPTVSGINTAERFGFKIQDLRDARRSLRTVAVRTNPDHWSKDAIRIVDRFANLVIRMDQKQRPLPSAEHSLDNLLAAS